MDWLHDQWQQIRGNVKWDFFKWLLAPALSASSYVLMQKLRHLSWDWWVFGGLFLVSFVVLILLGRRPDTSVDPNALMPVAKKSRLSIGTKLAVRSPNVVFSHCRVEAMSVEDEDYGATIFGAVVAEFFNDVSDPKDRADDIVAHLAYAERLNSDQQLRDPLWVSRQGVWLPGRVGDWDFEMNGRGRLLVALILREDNSKPPSICAVGFRPPDSLNPFRMETFELEEHLPVIVQVTLRGSGFQRRFGFILERSRESYICGQLPTPA